MSAFLDALHSGRTLLMDGAMGTELQRAGMAPGECYELWNVTHPDRVLAIHRAYVAAGAEVLLTNTFQANSAALAKHGLQHRLGEIQSAGVQLARAVAGPERFVLADIGPCDRSEAARLFDPFQAADGILLETMSDPEVLAAAITYQVSVPEGERLPLLISFSFLRDSDGNLRTHRGLSPEAVATQATESGAAALGTNCGRDISIDDIIEILRRYRSATDLPLFARPNAGTPRKSGSAWDYPCTPEAMAERLPELLDTGVAMIGGCCGTTPEHIKAFRPIVAQRSAL